MEDDTLHRQFLKTGSEEVLNLLMQKHYESIYGSVFSILRNHQDADEITNATFLKAYNKRETIKYPDKLLEWLYTTAKNAAIDKHRKNAAIDRRRKMSELTSLDSADGEREAAAASMLAARQAQQTETDQYLLRGILRLLSEKELEVVEYLMDGLKPKQIAEEIGSTAEAVQKRLERMRAWINPVDQQLDELLEDLQPQEQKIMERYLDNQPLKEISEKLGVSPHDVEVCVKRVIKRWKRTVTQNATTKVKRESN